MNSTCRPLLDSEICPINMAKSEGNKQSKQRSAKRPLEELSPPVVTKRSNSNVLKDFTNLRNPVTCKLCHQDVTENVTIVPDAQAECIVLTNDALASVYTDDFDDLQHNLTNYSIYDENGHLCSLDSGLIEKDVLLYLTGFVKPIDDVDPSVENGFPVTELGPILEWWLSSYDGDTRVVIGISTEYAEYVLLEPSPSYKKYMSPVSLKVHLANCTIEGILDNDYDDPTYEDILSNIVTSKNSAIDNPSTEEDLIAHAQFILDQVTEYDSNNPHSLPLAETQCIKTLAELSGAAKSCTKKILVKEIPKKKLKLKAKRVEANIGKREYSKATSTELVKDICETMFAAQLDGDNKEVNQLIEKKHVKKSSVCPSGVLQKNEQFRKNMFVVFQNKDSGSNSIGRIEYIFKENLKNKAHVILLTHSYHTILGDVSDRQELFVLKKCTSIDVNDIERTINVKHKVHGKDWAQLGNSKLEDLLEPVDRDDKNNSFFYQQQYDGEFGVFRDAKLDSPTDGKSDHYCSVCEEDKLKKESKIPKLSDFIQRCEEIRFYYYLKFNNDHFKVGNFVYLPPDIFSKSSRTNMVNIKPFVHPKLNKNKNKVVFKKIDETKYPELYRKSQDCYVRGSNNKTPDPFEIGEILAIYTVNNKMNVKLVVRRMYRAENLPLDNYFQTSDMNMLLWSDEEFRVLHEDICGKCFVAFASNIKEDPLTWSSGGPDRFYFKEKYDITTGSVIDEHQLSPGAKGIGKEVSVNYNIKAVEENLIQNIPSHEKIRPLNCLDIFAGCGGLSRGLEDSGLVNSKWAIESDRLAAGAFKLNNPESTVFVEDCNDLLKSAIAGNPTNSKNQTIPQKGEVEFICGGPPCQGFSGMNRFNSGQYSMFKNSLIVSFLSYVDYYRPKYFIMENVRNFVSFKQNMILKLTLRCITRIGYQCTFGILQAGNFGVPQTRRRLIIMAAAPGEKLPLYPDPIHVFDKRSSSLTIQVGDNKFRTNCKYEKSAPMRTVTVYDAWSDLPEIANGANAERIEYRSTPLTHLQKIFRYPDKCSSDSVLVDHICKDMSPLVQARMSLIPVEEGSDWRNLPNIQVKLSNGVMTNMLVYDHEDKKNGKSCDGALRGVCPCASGEKCDPRARQNNTIIPWCLPHTGNRHNDWSHLYGRIWWNGYCSTTITNPEPMGKQGRVLHPEQNRVVSVRECARSQGFSDSFLFCGPILNKHRQIGNAVPPPMGLAIGLEFVKVIGKKI